MISFCAQNLFSINMCYVMLGVALPAMLQDSLTCPYIKQ